MPRVSAEVERVIDGDTIVVRIRGVLYTVRYIGVDTPELADPRPAVGALAQQATEQNRRLVGGKTVELEKDVSETDRYNRLLRYVYAGGLFVNAELVRLGYAQAVSYPPDVRHQETLRQMEREARQGGRGLWSAAPASGEATPAGTAPIAGGCPQGCATPPPGCLIKGNISVTTGEKIYHLPGGEFYDQTVVNPSAGERWFCTEEEAAANGWRRSKR